jgi:hypothetical protein
MRRDSALVPPLGLPRAAWPRLALSLTLLLGMAAAVRVCAAPLDVSGTAPPPAFVASGKENDAVAYPAHVALATTLEAFHCSATATGLQWLKAAAHARSAAEVARAASGLSAARQRSSAADPLGSALCEFLRGGTASAGQASALAQAGIVCPVEGPGVVP